MPFGLVDGEQRVVAAAMYLLNFMMPSEHQFAGGPDAFDAQTFSPIFRPHPHRRLLPHNRAVI